MSASTIEQAKAAARHEATRKLTAEELDALANRWRAYFAAVLARHKAINRKTGGTGE